MKFLFASLASLLFLSQDVNAHMGISGMVLPNGQTASLKSRSEKAQGDPFRYPNAGVCHGFSSPGDLHTLRAGDTYKPKLSFGAPHGGGHCAWAVSTDMNTWTKLSDSKACTLKADDPVTIPSTLPPACAQNGCILSWFWTPVQSGSCEIYQNCFDIKVDVATGGIETTNPQFTHGPQNEINCRRVDDRTHWTTNYGPLVTSSGGGGGGGSPPTTQPPAPTAAPPTSGNTVPSAQPPSASPPTNPAPTPGSTSNVGCENLPVYSSGATYVGGDKVVFEGKEYRAKWWTRGDNPSSGGVWNLVRPCNTDGSSVTNQVCGGISAWSPTATYSGGALVHHKNVIYKAKWWSRGGDIETADSWSKQSECAKVEAAVATSPQGLQSNAPAAVALLGVDNIVNVEAESEATSFTVYLSVLLEGIQAGKTAADLEVIEGSLVGVLEVQYGIFVPKNSIKDVVFKDQGPGTVSLVAELHFPSLHAAEDAQAVMSEYEANVRETIKSIAKSRAGVDVETVSFDGTSVVAEGISVNLDVVNGVGSVLPSFLYVAIASLIVMVL